MIAVPVAFLNVILPLERYSGVVFTANREGPLLKGNLAALTSGHKKALSPYAKELRNLCLWRRLQLESQAKFGSEESRLYPLFANPAGRFWEGPKLLTPRGPAHLVQVVERWGRLALADEVAMWRANLDSCNATAPMMFSAALWDIWPPLDRGPNEEEPEVFAA